MLALNVRRLVAYAATGIFFVVAAMGLVQGGSPWDAFGRAGLACGIVTCLGRMVVHIVDAGVK